MASTVQVILKENLENLGTIGDVVRVRRGYARNYLMPRGLAAMATRSNVKQAEHEKAIQERRIEKLRAEQQSTVDQLAKLVVMIAKETSETGKLFGSVTSAEVVEALALKEVEVDKRKLVMPTKPIKEVGSYEVGLKLLYGLVATFKVEVKTKA